jgi:hypothetical protein
VASFRVRRLTVCDPVLRIACVVQASFMALVRIRIGSRSTAMDGPMTEAFGTAAGGAGRSTTRTCSRWSWRKRRSACPAMLPHGCRGRAAAIPVPARAGLLRPDAAEAGREFLDANDTAAPPMQRPGPPLDRPRRGLVGGGTSASTTWMQCSHQFHTAASCDSHIVEAECGYEDTDASDRDLSGVRWSSAPPGRYASRARDNSARG